MARRKNDDGHRRPRSDLTANRDAIHIGKTEVKYYQLRALGGCDVDPFAAGACFEDSTHAGLDGITHDAPDLRFVVYDEDDWRSHASTYAGRLGEATDSVSRALDCRPSEILGAQVLCRE
jgi:hypothetical protein